MNRVKRPHDAWSVCLGCCLVLFCTMGLCSSGFAIYQPYIIAAGHFSNTQGAAILTVRNVASLCTMTFVDKFHQKLGLRRGVVVGTLLAGFAFFCYSLAHSFPAFCAASAISGIAFSLGGIVPVSVIIAHWFHRSKTLAMGLCSAGSSFSAIVAPPAITLLIQQLGLVATFRLEGAFILLLALLAFLLIHAAPADLGKLPLGEPAAPTPGEPARQSGYVISPAVMALLLFSFVLMGAMSSASFSQLPMLYKTEGVDPVNVALMMSVIGVFITVIKPIYGRIVDKAGAYRSNYLFFSCFLLGLLLSCGAGLRSLPLATAAMTFLGIGYPVATVGLTTVAGELADEAHYESLAKRIQSSYMVGALSFGLVPGAMADLSGSYVSSYILMTGLALLCFVLIQGIYIHLRKRAA